MVEIIAKSVFWSSVAALAYVYVGYPLLVWLVSKVRPIHVRRAEVEPDVTVLITAYNEELAIREKILNTLALDYPAAKLEIIVASDGSTDRTDEIVGEFTARGVRLFRQEGRVGKTITQNNAVATARGEIILFSDATTDYPVDVIRQILPAFGDETVGCVAGKLVYVDRSASDVGTGAKSYWNYETFIKVAESSACSLIGASGCLYAVRRHAYRPMYAEACSDFLICSVLYEQGLRTVYEPNAVCTEDTNQQTSKEFAMRVRVILQTLNDLAQNWSMLNPFRYGFFAVQLISHKVLRYLVPLFLILMFGASLIAAFSGSLFFEAIVIGQSLFYIAAAAGRLAEKLGIKLGVFGIPTYFVLANLAALIALLSFFRGQRIAVWEPIRQKKKESDQESLCTRDV